MGPTEMIRTEKEHVRRPHEANKVMVTRVTNEEMFDREIFPGCQLLSVNDTPVTDRKSLVQLLNSTSSGVAVFGFMCPQNTPLRYTKRGRDRLQELKAELAA